MDYTHWHAKLAAWTHDPAEKALVLLRDPAGHEWGTAADLREMLFAQRAIPDALSAVVRQADHWASAADRPQWPRDAREGTYPAWAQVRFTEQPVLRHPLSGEAFDLGKLSDVGVEEIKELSLTHFRKLAGADQDARKRALAFWRFGPVLREDSGLGEFWGLLPADTRVPDHTIWQHLDLTAAFAGALFADPEGNPALLTVSLGPVQDFIAQARTTSDLWAGSHLLSRIAWEAMKVVCDRFGPDAVLFPQLGLPSEWFEDEPWARAATDANPLFAAALPNRFVALVPAAAAEGLGEVITRAVRDWVIERADAALDYLLDRAPFPGEATVAREQIRAQLDGFPEVHWAAVPWQPFVQEREGRAPETAPLREALSVFYPEGAGVGFLDSRPWKLLSRELTVEGHRFYIPNPGTLYPALYDLLDRAQAASKSVRAFRQLPQEGYRCSLCGEREWLSGERGNPEERTGLFAAPGKRVDTLWTRVQGTGLARKGEHLCAPCTLKRVWPNLFAHEAGEAVGRNAGERVDRFVVSTHAMALATPIDRLLEQWGPDGEAVLAELSCKHDIVTQDRPAALPASLHRRIQRTVDASSASILKRLPSALDRLRDADDRSPMDQALKGLFGDDGRPETYYALILMDGDRMGAWISGQGTEGESYRLPFAETWHPQVREALKARHREGDLATYMAERRPVSPARHMAISSALNGFALHVVRHIVEEEGKGKLIYAGGDDVLAMVSVDDLLRVMFLLRLAYGGLFPVEPRGKEQARTLLGLSGDRFDLRRGHVRLYGRLHRMMGHRATASMGAVVAHHQAPLGAVLRQLRAAESRAKDEGGRDAFAIHLLKRSGGAVRLVSPWLARSPWEEGDWQAAMEENLEQTPMGQLIRLRDRFAGPEFSRRAAYITQGWLTDLPDDPAALQAMLSYQFTRQGGGEVMGTLGRRLGELAARVAPCGVKGWVEEFLAVAEFLARQGRTQFKPSSGG
jgi:CRISPR-associated protein Cmr2